MVLLGFSVCSLVVEGKCLCKLPDWRYWWENLGLALVGGAMLNEINYLLIDVLVLPPCQLFDLMGSSIWV